ncbi:MAG: hypothetical protein M0P95_09290 [Sulfuritalea sp.]|jgi:hypothetical protein|nr:hypothetical protein [Sulfuritalea sp.]
MKQRAIHCLLIALGLAMSAPAAWGLVCNSNGTAPQNWNNNLTWSCTATPGAADDVTINAGHNISLNGTNRLARNFTIAATGTLTTGNNGLTIQNNGVVQINGVVQGNGNANSLFTKTGTGGLSGTGSFNNLQQVNLNGSTTIAAGSALTLTGAECRLALAAGVTVTNNGTLTYNTPAACGSASTLTLTATSVWTNANNGTVTAGTVTGSSGAIWTNAANSTLNVAAAFLTTAGTVLNASGVPNTVNYNGTGTQTVKLPSGGNYHHLTVSGGNTKTLVAGTYNIAGNLTINSGPTLTANSNDPTINVAGNVTIDGTYIASNQVASPLTIGGNMSVGGTGTYTGNVAPVNLAGNFTNSGTFTSSTGAFTFNGSASQTLTGATTFTNMTVNNSGAGLQLASDITATTGAAGTLVLTAGTVTTGANTLIVPRSCTTPSVTRSGGWVAGNLRLQFPTGTPSCTFAVGDGSAYRPIDMSFASVTTAGSLTGTVSQLAGEHPNIAASGLDAARDVNRYWTLSNPAGGTIAFTTYSATFNFINPGDFDVGATPASFEIEGWDGSVWNNTTLSAAGATSTAASGLPSFAAGSSNSFAVGEKKGPYVVSIILASPDPTSPATSVDWTVTFNANVTGVDATDFALVQAGGVSGAAITGVTGGGTTWTVTASTGAGAGTLGLNLVDDDTILNAALKPLGGTGTGNGNFTGQVYTVVYTASGYVFTDAVCTDGVAFGPGQPCAKVIWSPQVAGQNLTGVYITAVNTSGIPTRLHASQVRTRNMEFGLSCHNPVADAGRQAAFAGVTPPLCQASGATPTTWSPTVTVTFPGGSPSSNVSYTFNYADVGSVELWMRNNATPTETGNSGAFVVKPGGFALSAIQQTAAPNLANPAAAGAGGAKFVKAGEAFSVTVTATTVDGVTAAPNYGKETVPESVMLTVTLVAPAGGASPALQNATGFGVFTSGIATGTSFAWDEVGIITLTPSVGDGDYLGAGDATGAVSVNVGRFYPYQFNLTGPSLTPGTCTFNYLDQPFGAALILTAKNAGGSTTTNYTTASSFAKLDPTNTALWPSTTLGATGFALGARNGTSDLSVRLSLDGTPTGAWTSGEVTVSAQIKLARPTTTIPDATWGAYENLDIGVAPQDGDGVTLPAAALDMDANGDSSNERKALGQTKARFGRLRLLNAYGSELLPIRVPVRAEYYNGTNWTLNTTDSCTVLTPGALAIGSVTKPAGSSLAFAIPPAGIAGSPSATLASGATDLRITPSTNGVGSADLILNLGGIIGMTSCVTLSSPVGGGTPTPTLAFLAGNWCGASYDKAPLARIKFGSPKAPYIYLRERY